MIFLGFFIHPLILYLPILSSVIKSSTLTKEPHFLLFRIKSMIYCYSPVPSSHLILYILPSSLLRSPPFPISMIRSFVSYCSLCCYPRSNPSWPWPHFAFLISVVYTGKYSHLKMWSQETHTRESR